VSLLEKIKKNSTIELSSSISESTVLLDKFECPTSIPAINIALGGGLKSGLTSGITIFAGESKRFKSMYSLFLVSEYMKKFPESVCLFYDSEFGTPLKYFEKFGIEVDRVVHTPITDVEELKHDIVSQLKALERNERVIIMIDSLGNLASKKEIDDAQDGKVVADMSRAKSMKSLFRMITPLLAIKDIPMIAINHVYAQIGAMFPQNVQNGGTGVQYSPNSVFFVGREQTRDGTDVIGYKFSLNIEKSRLVQEKSKFPIEVSFENGINKWSALLDIAMDIGFVVSPTKGWYSRVYDDGSIEEKKWRRKDTDSNEFWDALFDNPEFDKAIIKRYRLD